MKALHFSIIVCLSVIISACGTSPKVNQSKLTKVESPAPKQPEELISLALKSTSPKQQSKLFFQAAQSYWENNLYAQSDAALGSVQIEHLNEADAQDYLLMSLKLATSNKNKARIEKILPLIPNLGLSGMNVDQQIELSHLLSQAYEITDLTIEAAITLIDHRGLINPEHHQDTDEQIWHLLRSTETADLSQYIYTGDNPDALAWLDLARTIQLNQISLDAQYNAFQAWNELWPSHPASLNPPHELSILKQLPNTRPDSITLALPLSGPLQLAGKAIRDGFMAQHYASNKQNPNHEPLQVRFFDTATQDILSLYNQAPETGSLIIGPLDKASLKALNSLDIISTPTLALNYLPATNADSDKLYQLGLAPETEARQLATRLHDKSLKRVGIILPENNLGFRIYDSFVESFSSLDGVVIDSVFYKNQKSLASSVARLLGTEDSQNRKRKIRKITNTALEFLPRRRQDIDALVMIAKPEIARQIKPLFAYHYAADLPVFASSQIHNISDNNDNRDLDGIEFIEMPWMLSSTIDIKSQINHAIPESTEQYSRFYALGADSYNIAPRLQLLHEVRGSQMQGHTGMLSMDEQGIINRQLEWAKFRKGKAVTIKE
ncbi:hypothetical protein A3743_03750 [Oleiphilus sp. HI0072]|nr:hypothetical protein A3743_03750 [Oleiphilus sp. HI0072]